MPYLLLHFRLLTLRRQRLLFRVLHAMSLYLPETGYVQGMAALAATLLCYYEEDRAFVMLVRLWMHRGLERLYESGFAGLMDALEEFEKNWLRGGDVAKKLVSPLSPGYQLQACRTLPFASTMEWLGNSRSARFVESSVSRTSANRDSCRRNYALHRQPMAPDGT